MLLIFVTDMPLALLNVVAGVVYALAMPFVALVTAYVYFDARARGELEPVDEPSELPAEIELSHLRRSPSAPAPTGTPAATPVRCRHGGIRHLALAFTVLYSDND